MWHGIRLPARTDVGFVTSATDLLQSTSKQLFLLVAGVCVLWYFLGVVALPDRVIMKLFPIAVLIVWVSICAVRLLSWSTLAAQVIWQVGLAAAVTLGMYVSRRSEVGFLYTLLPLIAAVSAGWRGVLLSAGLVAVLVWWLTLNPAMIALSPAMALSRVWVRRLTV